MAHRHKIHKSVGGALAYNAKGSHVLKEAKERKHGGAANLKAHGHKGKHRLDKRARGGRTGSNNNPFSSAKRHEMGNETGSDHSQHPKP
jgi:hypothetical protein